MKNMLLDCMETTLKFSYPIPQNVAILGYETLDVKAVEVDCTFLCTGEIYLEYKLRIDGLDLITLPTNLFDDDLISNANRSSLELLEQQIRARVQKGVPSEKLLEIAKSKLSTTCSYAITPEVAGCDDVRIVVHCKWSGGNEYHYHINLYASGIDLGRLSTTDATNTSRTLLNLRERSEQFAETMLGLSSFETVLEMLCSCKNI